MAGKIFSKGSEEWMLFMDFWKICQQHWEPENNETYWKTMLDGTSQFINKYKDFDFARILAEGFVYYIEIKAKKMGIPIN